MPTLNVFKENAFSMMSLTAAINKLPYVPKLMQTLGVFTEQYVTTTDVFIEERQGKLSLLPRAARGTINAVRSTPTRIGRTFAVPHVPQFQTIAADDVQNIRAFGAETEVEVLASYVNDQLAAMRANHEATHEYHRIGALTGKVLDADGSTVIVDLLNEFNVTQEEIDFDFDVADFSRIVNPIVRTIADRLGDAPFQQIYAICGNEYFDAVKSHDSVKVAFDRWRNGEFLRMAAMGPEWYSIAARGFAYNDVMFLNYRGAVGAVKYIADDEAYYFATGVPDLFLEIYAPANFNETVNTRALKFYAKQEPCRFDMGIELHTQSNMLAVCTRPSSVVKSTVSDYPGTGT